MSEELELIEKAIGHLSSAIVGISEAINKTSYAKLNGHLDTRDALLEEIHTLTETIVKVQTIRLEHDLKTKEEE